MHKRAPKKMSQFTPSQNAKNNTKRKLNRKQTKRKGANTYKKNTQKQNKIQHLFVYKFLHFFLILNFACINAEPTSKRSKISFPDTYYSFY